MANILGLKGFNPSSGTNRLFAAYGNGIQDIANSVGYSVNLTTTNDVEFEVFMDNVFMQNGVDRPRNFDRNNNRWQVNLCAKMPISRYLKKFKNRLFLGNCTIPYVTQEAEPHAWDEDPMEQRYGTATTITEAATHPSRVFYSDLPKSKTELTWGLYWSRVLGRATLGNQSVRTRFISIESRAAKKTFKSVNIKVGDPVTITDNSLAAIEDFFLVTKVDSHLRLEVDREVDRVGGDSSGWVGSNWFDVAADDGDEIKGFGENSDRLLIFKLMSLWYYTGSQLKQVKGAPGTSYNRSIINDQYGNTYYFHGSDPKKTGIYKYNGVSAIKLSRAIDPFILAMNTANYDNVVAWAEGNEIRFYLGDLSATNQVDSMTNAVATYNVDTGAWTVEPIADVVTCSTTFRTSGVEDTYLGTSDDEILQADDGYSHNGTPIRSNVETKVYYPAGSEIICEHPFLQVISRNARGLRFQYKLWNDVEGKVDDRWWPLGEIENDKTEFALPLAHQAASGVQLKVDDYNSVENDWYVEKLSGFYRPDRARLKET